MFVTDPMFTNGYSPAWDTSRAGSPGSRQHARR
jgi:hypothetical protein